MALEWLAERISPEKIWAFLGNHDAYGGAIDHDEKLRNIIENFGGHYAQKAEVRLTGSAKMKLVQQCLFKTIAE